MQVLGTTEPDAPLGAPGSRPAPTPRAAVCILAPSRIIGEAFRRALATGGWAIDVIDPIGVIDLSTGASTGGQRDWWEGRLVVIVFESMLRSVPVAVRRGEPGVPSIVVLDDGSSPRGQAASGHPVQTSIESLHRSLAASTGPDPLGPNLTARHREILQLVAVGCTTEEVGERLGIASKTVNNHLSTMYRRMHAHNLTQAVLMAVRAGLVDVTR